jgi:hypothetical protein
MRTIVFRSAIFLFALFPLSAAGQGPAGRVTQIDAVSVSPNRFKVLGSRSFSTTRT